MTLEGRKIILAVYLNKELEIWIYIAVNIIGLLHAISPRISFAGRRYYM
jgi:hypothetical protein